MPGATWSKNPVPDGYDEPYGESNAIGLLVLVLVAAAIALAFVAGMRMDICACVLCTRVYMYSRAGGGAARHTHTLGTHKAHIDTHTKVGIAPTGTLPTIRGTYARVYAPVRPACMAFTAHCAYASLAPTPTRRVPMFSFLPSFLPSIVTVLYIVATVSLG